MSGPHVLIVDDEALARARLRGFLQARRERPRIQEASNGLEALELLRVEKPDLVFLDIEMPELSGFELLAQLEDRNFQLIFQTAHDEFAIRAFEASACDYLLKPFDRERFDQAFERALARRQEREALAGLERELRARDGYLKNIAARIGGKTLLVPVGEVLAFLSQDHYTTLLSPGRELLLDLSLSHLEDRLDPARFQRLHRNNIVAVDRIRAVHNGENLRVELEGGILLPVARSKRSRVLELLRRK